MIVVFFSATLLEECVIGDAALLGFVARGTIVWWAVAMVITPRDLVLDQQFLSRNVFLSDPATVPVLHINWS